MLCVRKSKNIAKICGYIFYKRSQDNHDSYDSELVFRSFVFVLLEYKQKLGVEVFIGVIYYVILTFIYLILGRLVM